MLGVYVRESHQAALEAYKYAGEDRSYLYRYALRPLSLAIAEHVMPIWLAPNVITLSGFTVMCSATCLSFAFNPQFDSALPTWLYFYMALSVFVYQTLDNTDGAQARRTGTSSPLGMLFDHGVDALVMTFGAIGLSSMLRLGLGWQMLLIWMLPLIGFLLATWEEYHTGTLILPEFNGPSDGQALCVLFLLASGLTKGELWTWHVVSEFTVGDVVWLIVILTALSTFSVNFRHVKDYLQGAEMGPCLTQLFPFVIFLGGMSVWFAVSPANVFVGEDALLPWFIIGGGFMFAHMCCNIMISHILHENYSPVRYVLLPCFIIALLCALGVISEYMGVVFFVEWAILSWAHFAFDVTTSIAALLNINVFSIEPRVASAVNRKARSNPRRARPRSVIRG